MNASFDAAPIGIRRADAAVLVILLACSLALACLFKAPALARYAEQRFHLTLPIGGDGWTQSIESASLGLRAQTMQAAQTVDRSVVFGLQELTQGEISAQQAKQAQILLTYQTLLAHQQAQTQALSGLASPQAKGKNQKNKTQSPKVLAPTVPAALALATPFKADYAAHKLPLSSGDRILFVGDSLMQGVAPHAASAMSKALPGIFTLDLSRQSTGLAYAGFFDWPSTAARAIAQHRINTLVVFIGANDFYDMPIQGKKFTVGTPQWELGYSAVVQAMMANAHAAGVRVLWLEMPPMDKPLLRDRLHALNAVYAKSAATQKVRWVATADTMSNEGGAYSKFLPNSQGSLVQMRLDDGVHFTVTGQKRLASRLLAQFVYPEQAKP